MTFKEIIETCTFEEVLPTLLQMSSEHEDAMVDYRMVFDDLRLRKAEPSDIKISLGGNGHFIGVSCISPKISSYCAFCYPWNESLGMEVCQEENIHLSNAEIVAHCLWQMTYYGFSEKEIHETFDEMLTSRRKDKSEEEQANPRFYKIKAAIQKFTSNSEINPEQMNYLFDTTCITDRIFTSFVETKNERAQYITDLLSEYQFCDFNEYNRFCLLFNSSSKHKITVEEKEIFNKIREIFPDEANIIWADGTDDSLDDKIELLFLASYDE